MEKTTSSEIFLGVDTAGAEKPFTCAAVDGEGKLLILRACELEEVLSLLQSNSVSYVAINAPARPNQGLLRERLARHVSYSSPLRRADMRLVEYELRQRGIHIAATPQQVASCAPWVQLGFGLYQRLTELGFDHYSDSRDRRRQVIETNAHAVFCVLLGKQPLPKATLEGRLQRQALLHERGLGIQNPMDFFEEITLYRLMRGRLPWNLIYRPEELDALAASYVAYLAATQPMETIGVGPGEEGQIVLPVRELKESYS